VLGAGNWEMGDGVMWLYEKWKISPVTEAHRGIRGSQSN